MRLARALELTHNIASTPNSIEGLDSLLVLLWSSKPLNRPAWRFCASGAAAGNDALVRDFHSLLSPHVGMGCGQPHEYHA